MTPEHEANLRARFPRLYSEPYLRVDGFMRCGDGWFGIIERLSLLLEEKIAALPEAEQHHYRAEQVKEKFGSLRFYMSKETPGMYDPIHWAETESTSTCEHCGEPGMLRSGGWVRTLCDACHAVTEREKAARKP